MILLASVAVRPSQHRSRPDGALSREEATQRASVQARGAWLCAARGNGFADGAGRCDSGRRECCRLLLAEPGKRPPQERTEGASAPAPPRPRAPAPPRPRDASAGVASTNASREMSGALAREQAGGNPYAGQGAKWLQTPV
jgi:hypothetical protein